MNYELPIHEGTLIRRYKRFLADVVVDGKQITVLCPNTGSMSGLLDSGNPVRISGPHPNTKRKYAYTLEQIRITRHDKGKFWVGVNTGLPNAVVDEAIHEGNIPGLEGYRCVRREVKLGDHSRIDLFLSEHRDGLPDCWVEVKNCTSVQDDVNDKASQNVGLTATFPDAVTTRGQKHVRELIERVQHGERAAMVFTVQRGDARQFSPAWAFDPDYAGLFYTARSSGLEMMPMVVDVTGQGLEIKGLTLPILEKP
ncbi:MAG: DNA/RNA nuclease SfsA [bacterium]